MTAEERADKVEIVEEDCGDWHVSDWRVSEDRTRANIANAIREAERDAEKRMRERAAKLLEYATMTIRECEFHGIPVNVSPPAGKTAVEHHVELLRGLAAAIRLLEVS